MSWQEFTGKSVKEAVSKACEELATDEALLEVEVLEESTRGFLGIVGQKDARIRARKRDLLKAVLEYEEEPAVQQRKPEEPAEQFVAEAQVPDEDIGEFPLSTRPSEPEADSPFLEEACTVLKEILQRMQVEAEVEASMLEGAIYLDIKGDGSGLLIGKKGQTLDALQYVVNKIINKESVPVKRWKSSLTPRSIDCASAKISGKSRSR